jgi:hypothetical protein
VVGSSFPQRWEPIGSRALLCRKVSLESSVSALNELMIGETWILWQCGTGSNKGRKGKSRCRGLASTNSEVRSLSEMCLIVYSNSRDEERRESQPVQYAETLLLQATFLLSFGRPLYPFLALLIILLNQITFSELSVMLLTTYAMTTHHGNDGSSLGQALRRARARKSDFSFSDAVAAR